MPIGPDNYPSQCAEAFHHQLCHHLSPPLSSLSLISQQDEISLCSEDRELFECGWV